MATLNFNQPLMGPDNKPVTYKDGDTTKTMTVGEQLAEFLNTERKPDNNSRKTGAWAEKLFLGEPLELDKADRKMLDDLIEGTERIIASSKYQLHKIFDAVPKDAD